MWLVGSTASELSIPEVSFKRIAPAPSGFYLKLKNGNLSSAQLAAFAPTHLTRDSRGHGVMLVTQTGAVRWTDRAEPQREPHMVLVSFGF